MTWISTLFGSGGAVVLATAMAADGVPGLQRIVPATIAAVEAVAAPPARSDAPESTPMIGTLPEVATPLRVARARDGLFYLRAQINGRPVRFLVDTGASVTILTPRDAKRVGAAARRGGGTLRLRTASGHGTLRWAALKRLTVGGQDMRQVDAAIGDAALPVSLLGQNVLTRLGSVRISGNELHLS